MQHRQYESRCLAGPGLGAGKDVAAGEDCGYWLRLDRRRDGVTFFGNGAQQGLGEPEFGKWHDKLSYDVLGHSPCCRAASHSQTKELLKVGVDCGKGTGTRAARAIIAEARSL